jgi:hypothetical protein
MCPAALIADAGLKSLLWHRLGRARFWEIVVNRDNALPSGAF